MIRIDRRQLLPLSPLGEGGMAQVSLVGGKVPQIPGRLAVKELKPSVVEPDRTRMLTTMRLSVALRDAMSPADQKDIDEATVWPLAMVHDNGADIGILMRCLDDDFFIDAQPKRRIFEFQLLSADAVQAKALGIDKSRARADDNLVRLALMARLAYGMELIHRARGSICLVYGDLSLRNAAVATNPPRIMLMDCDGVADVNDLTRVQPHTPFFQPPEVRNKQQKLQDERTDVYKLGLCVIRGLARGRGATQLCDPKSPLIPKGLLDKAGTDLLELAVGADRARRPSAEDIKDYLIGRVLALASPPELLSVKLSSNVALRGSEVFITWDHQGATKVRIYSDVRNFEVKDLDPDAYPNGYPVRPPTSCELWVEVSNDHGSVALSPGRLDYYELPALRIDINPPALWLPELPGMRLPETHAALPAYPMLAADAVPLPALRWPHLPSLNLEEVVPNAQVADLQAAVGHAYHAVDVGIDEAVGDVLERHAQNLRKKATSVIPAQVPSP